MPKVAEIANRLAELEAEYRANLVRALRKCAGGQWGLFGHNEHLTLKAPLPDVVRGLIDLARDIDALRRRAGLEPFALHERFLVSRGRQSANAPGEPKQAQEW